LRLTRHGFGRATMGVLIATFPKISAIALEHGLDRQTILELPVSYQGPCPEGLSS
jgi:hypothetical protein